MAQLEAELRELDTLVVGAQKKWEEIDPESEDAQAALEVLNKVDIRIDDLLREFPASVILEVTQQIATRDPETTMCHLQMSIEERITANQKVASALGNIVLGMELDQ